MALSKPKSDLKKAKYGFLEGSPQNYKIQVAMTTLAKDSGVIGLGTLQKTIFCLFQVTFCLIKGPKCPNQTESILFFVI